MQSIHRFADDAELLLDSGSEDDVGGEIVEGLVSEERLDKVRGAENVLGAGLRFRIHKQRPWICRHFGGSKDSLWHGPLPSRRACRRVVEGLLGV